MQVRANLVVLYGLFAAIAWPQSADPVGSEPSPLEAFAKARGARIAWSGELARWERDGNRLVLAAVVVENDTPYVRKIPGVRIDLSNDSASDRIYLDEPAIARTRSALQEISDAVGPTGIPGHRSCMGAMEFWPLYGWPWNKYHELNASFCGGPENTTLVLHGRGKEEPFSFAGKRPDDLARILASALDELKQH